MPASETLTLNKTTKTSDSDTTNETSKLPFSETKKETTKPLVPETKVNTTENLTTETNNETIKPIAPEKINLTTKPSASETVNETTTPCHSGDLSVSFCEFKNALEFNNYPPPSEQQYKSFSSQMVSKGGIHTKREAAMFLAQVIHESGGLRFKSELACQVSGCPDSYQITTGMLYVEIKNKKNSIPHDFFSLSNIFKGVGIPGKRYFGRGYMQLVTLNFCFLIKQKSCDKIILNLFISRHGTIIIR